MHTIVSWREDLSDENIKILYENWPEAAIVCVIPDKYINTKRALDLI